MCEMRLPGSNPGLNPGLDPGLDPGSKFRYPPVSVKIVKSILYLSLDNC